MKIIAKESITKVLKGIVISIVRSVVSIWFSIPLLFLIPLRMFHGKLAKVPSLMSYHVALTFANVVSKFSKSYCLIELLPKYSEDVAPCGLLTDTKKNEYAIVMQGPVLDDFTAETVRIYRKIFPKAYIIVSTWKSTDAKLSEELKALADEVILSEPPETSGVGNINYQTKSSYAGIKRAYELGIPYAMKTRVDQRIYNPMIFEYMKSMLEAFPLDSRYSQWQKERIVVLPGGGIATHYYIADYFQFGTTQDLLNFFDFPPDPVVWDRSIHDKYFHSHKNKWHKGRGNPYIQLASEIQLIKSYVMRCGPGNCRSTVKNYWEDIKGRFIVLNRSDLRLYWNKYYFTSVNFWRISEHPYSLERDEDRVFTAQLCMSLIKGHLLYDSKFEEYKKHMIEPFKNLGTFCLGYERLDEILEDIRALKESKK